MVVQSETNTKVTASITYEDLTPAATNIRNLTAQHIIKL